jgi:hypothetical protein
LLTLHFHGGQQKQEWKKKKEGEIETKKDAMRRAGRDALESDLAKYPGFKESWELLAKKANESNGPSAELGICEGLKVLKACMGVDGLKYIVLDCMDNWSSSRMGPAMQH